MVLVAVVLYGIVPGIVKVGGWFELFFVNTLGMSFNSGVIVYIILLAACLIWGVYESYNEKSKSRMALSFILTIAMLGIPFYGHEPVPLLSASLSSRCCGSISNRARRRRLRRDTAYRHAH